MEKSLGIAANTGEFCLIKLSDVQGQVSRKIKQFEKRSKKSRILTFLGPLFFVSKKMGVAADASELITTRLVDLNQKLRFGRVVFEKKCSIEVFYTKCSIEVFLTKS